MAGLQQDRSAFSYSAKGQKSCQPTALAGLALLADDGKRPLAVAAGQFLAKIQQVDGSVGLTATLDHPRWVTSLALLLWSALPEIDEKVKNKAIEWLLKTEGVTFPDAKDRDHDNSIPGWPWFEGNYSWIEPTCYALLALSRQGKNTHARCKQGFKLLLDRALPAGGWNYGSVSLYGNPLRPQVPTTGIALLALSCAEKPPAPALIDKACQYIQRSLHAEQTPKSLGWGMLGLRAWGRLPQAHDEWLAQCWSKSGNRTENALELALFILAAWPESLRYIGCQRER